MHPIVTIKSWGHNAHMMQMHELAENANKLFHDAAFWALVILMTLFVAAFLLVFKTPPDTILNTAPMYPFPFIM